MIDCVNGVLILNGKAGTASIYTEIKDACESQWQCRQASDGKDAVALATRAAEEGQPIVIAGGGDGSVNAVVNGLMAYGSTADDRPLLLILPLGTGNDLARTLDLASPHEAVAAIAEREGGSGSPHHIVMDVLRVRTPSSERFAANSVVGGLGPAVDKGALGVLSYLKNGLSKLAEWPDHRATVHLDDRVLDLPHLNFLAVANARSAGGGFPLAPQADPTDGLLDLIALPLENPADLRPVAEAYLSGSLAGSEQLITARARKVRVQANPDIAWRIDGDDGGEGDLEVEIMPKALNVIVGKSYRQ